MKLPHIAHQTLNHGGLCQCQMTNVVFRREERLTTNPLLWWDQNFRNSGYVLALTS